MAQDRPRTHQHAQNPAVTVLDEPTAALDAYGEQAVFRNAHTLARAAGAQRGGLTVLVTHRAASASIADHIITLKRPRFSAGDCPMNGVSGLTRRVGARREGLASDDDDTERGDEQEGL